MRVIRKAREAGSRIVALGTFDGVHLGHRALLAAAKDYATEYRIPLRVCTFDRHPLEVIRPDQAPPILTTIPEKAAEGSAGTRSPCAPARPRSRETISFQTRRYASFSATFI